jgi:MATE family multidrug resistance protein
MALGFQEYRHDIRSMLRMAVPLAFAELGWMSMSVVDSIMVGRLPNSAVAIGATSIGSGLFYSFAIFGVGLMSGLDTLVSQAYGADDWPEARRSLISGVALALCVAPFLMALILGVGPLLGVIGVQSPVREEAIGFARVLVWSLPLLLIYTTFRRYLQGIHFVKPVTFALITSNLVNVFGNWILIYGNWGAPAMGVRGSALATGIARF